MIGKFKQSIVFKNTCYYVKLPWFEDKIHLVPSNYSVSLGILDRVVRRLEQSKSPPANTRIIFGYLIVMSSKVNNPRLK